MERPDDGCSCDKSRKRWRLIRLALLLAGLSLALYMPYKATVHYDKLQDIYGPWFLQGAVVAAAGLFYTLKPGLASRLPFLLRVGVAASAVLWMRTGLQCTPHLWNLTQTSLGAGLFASFHMLVQHVFLSLGVIAFAIAPRALGERMAAGVEDAAAEDTAVADVA